MWDSGTSLCKCNRTTFILPGTSAHLKWGHSSLRGSRASLGEAATSRGFGESRLRVRNTAVWSRGKAKELRWTSKPAQLRLSVGNKSRCGLRRCVQHTCCVQDVLMAGSVFCCFEMQRLVCSRLQFPLILRPLTSHLPPLDHELLKSLLQIRPGPPYVLSPLSAVL